MKHFLLFIALTCTVLMPASVWAQNDKIPFAYFQSMIFVKVKINGKGPFLFLLNTGANRSVIDSATAVRLKLPVAGRDSVEGTAGLVNVALVNTASIQMGPVLERNLVITRRNLKSSFLPSPAYLHGIIGTDILRKRAMVINFKTKQIQFPKSYKIPRNSAVLHFNWDYDTPAFPVVLNDTFKTRLRYNSGVSMKATQGVYINLAYETWAQLNGGRNTGAPQKYFSGAGVGGTVYLAMYPVNSMKMEGLLITGLNAIIQPREGYFKRKDAVGFFGNNLLEKYNEVIIDYPRRSLALPRVKVPPAATAHR